jgi:hypothetical protein
MLGSLRLMCSSDFGDVVSRQQLGRTSRILVALCIAPALFFCICSLLFVEVGDVVEHESAAFVVSQYTAFATHTLCYEDAANADRPNHASRMKLNELHVLEFGPGAIGQRKAVAGVFPTVAGDLEGAPNSAGGQHHSICLPQVEPALLTVVSACPGNSIRIEQKA